MLDPPLDLGDVGKAVTLNVQALSSRSNRLEFILTAFDDFALVMLQGTRYRADDHPIREWKIGKWLIVSAGYSARANGHAGVMTCVNLELIPEKCIKAYCYPDNKTVWGRALGIRFKWQDDVSEEDFVLHNVYCQPFCGYYTANMKASLVHLRKTTSLMPCRCLPIYAGDFNCKFGLLTGKTIESPTFGQARQESKLGTEIRDWMENFFLCALNTFDNEFGEGAQPTFFSTSGAESCIDYVISSQRAYSEKKIYS